jgi:hypothetical protein
MAHSRLVQRSRESEGVWRTRSNRAARRARAPSTLDDLREAFCRCPARRFSYSRLEPGERVGREAPLDRFPGYLQKRKPSSAALMAVGFVIRCALVRRASLSGSCASGRGFAPRFFQTPLTATPLDSTFATIRLDGECDHARHTTQKPRTSRGFRSSCEVISGGACDDGAHEAIPDDRPTAVRGLSARPTR